MPLFVKTPRNETVLAQCGPYPSGLCLMDRKQTAVQRQITRAGLVGFEPETQATLLTLAQLSRKPTEFFDVGAHIGLYSALVATIFPADLVHVTAFEPTPETAELCAALADANRVEINLQRRALTDHAGSARLFISDKAETSNSLRAGFRPSTHSVDVITTTLDEFCLERGVAPTVVKIDVETLESAVLRGGLATLARARPSIVCELLRETDLPLTREVLREVERLGYHAYAWDAEHGWAAHRVDEVGDLAGDVLRDWLLSPEELGEAFFAALDEWSAALEECTVEQNILVPGGTLPPDGWNAPYPVQHGIGA